MNAQYAAHLARLERMLKSAALAGEDLSVSPLGPLLGDDRHWGFQYVQHPRGAFAQPGWTTYLAADYQTHSLVTGGS